MRSNRPFLAEHLFSYGIEGSFRPGGNAHFCEDILQVNLDRILADVQPRGDFFVARSLSDQLKDFQFTIT
jgi:hypothetical protein